MMLIVLEELGHLVVTDAGDFFFFYKLPVGKKNVFNIFSKFYLRGKRASLSSLS